MPVNSSPILSFFRLIAALNRVARALRNEGDVGKLFGRPQGFWRLMKPSLFFLVCALMLGAMGCSCGVRGGGNANIARSEKEVEKEDGSVVVVSTSPNGIRTEARTFPSGDVSRVTRITATNGRRRGLVEFRDGRSAEIKDENEIDRVIEASANTVGAAAIKAWEARQAAGSEVSEKADGAANRAAEAGKDSGQTVGGAAKRGAEEAAKKGARKTGKGIKKVGEKIKNSVTP